MWRSSARSLWAFRRPSSSRLLPGYAVVPHWLLDKHTPQQTGWGRAGTRWSCTGGGSVKETSHSLLPCMSTARNVIDIRVFYWYIGIIYINISIPWFPHFRPNKIQGLFKTRVTNFSRPKMPFVCHFPIIRSLDFNQNFFMHHWHILVRSLLP